MAKKKTVNKKVVMGKFLSILIIGIILGVSCLFSTKIETLLGIGKKDSGFATATEIQNSDLVINYLDVGQGDSTFICLPDGTTMLIDAGTSSAAKDVVSYIKNMNINVIDHFIITHSDSDHCGGAKKILKEFEVKNIYRPFQIAVDQNGKAITDSKGKTIEELGYLLEYNEYKNISKVDTKTYADCITAVYNEVKESKANVFVSYDGLQIYSTNPSVAFTFEFFAPAVISTQQFDHTEAPNTKGYPVKTYSGTDAHVKNSSSPIMLLEYKDKSFVWTGDATSEVEEDFLNSIEYNIDEKVRFTDIDVYQAGHHGSSTSSSKDFVDQMTADYVVVSCGEDNSYEHPHQEFIERINGYSHSTSDYLLRTDLIENIVFGFNEQGQLVYTAVSHGQGTTIYCYQIAIGLFVILTIVIISVKITKNKEATAKRFVKKTKQVAQVYKKR